MGILAYTTKACRPRKYWPANAERSVSLYLSRFNQVLIKMLHLTDTLWLLLRRIVITVRIAN